MFRATRRSPVTANNRAKDTPRRLLDELLEDLNDENERLAADLQKALAEIAALRQQRDHLLVALREARERRARVSTIVTARRRGAA